MLLSGSLAMTSPGAPAPVIFRPDRHADRVLLATTSELIALSRKLLQEPVPARQLQGTRRPPTPDPTRVRTDRLFASLQESV